MPIKKIVLGSLVILALGGGLLWEATREDEIPPEAVSDSAPNVIDRARDAVTATEKRAEESMERASDTTLSIENFAKKNFDGKDFTVGQVIEKNNSYTRYYITYLSDGLKISGIMNVPAGAPPTGGFPVLFLNHGYIDQSIYTNGRGLKREQNYLAKKGYVVVHSDYRGHADSDDDTSVEENLRFGYAEDVINGVLALRAANLPYADTARIGMLGHSMGGGIVYLISVAKPKLVSAFVLFAPVSAEAWENFEKYTRDRQDVAARILEKYQTPRENKIFWDSVSPTNYFANITEPILIEHGTIDDSTPIQWSEKVFAELQKQGKDAKLDIYPGEPHEFTSAWPTAMRRTAEFFDIHVKK